MKITEVCIYTAERIARIKGFSTTKLDELRVGDCNCITRVKWDKGEYIVTDDTDIMPVLDDAHFTAPFTRVPLATLCSGDTDKAIAGVVVECGKPVSGTSKRTGASYKLRKVHITDEGGKRIELTLWGATAERCAAAVGDVLVTNSAKVEQYNGLLRLALTEAACLLLNPALPGCDALRQWYADSTTGGVLTGLASAVELAEMSLADADRRAASGENVRCCTMATISYINDEKMSYVACGQCNKGIHDGQCPTHGAEVGTTRTLYRLEMHVVQDGGMVVAMAFGDVGQRLFNMDVAALEALREREPAEFDRTLNGVTGSEYTLHLAFKLYRGANANKVECTLLHAEPYHQ